jgi:serine/threonine-protein kinase
MTLDPRILQLLRAWEEKRQQGQTPKPEELCRDCPELLPEFRVQLRKQDSLGFLVSTADESRHSRQETSDPNATQGLLVSDVAAEPPFSVTSAGQRYRQDAFHARGGMGEVYKALDREIGREVALKRIKKEVALNPELRRRFLREAEITGRLEHPGIVPVYGLIRDETGQPCYAMRFIEGESLKDAIQKFYDADQAKRDPGDRSLAFRQLLQRFIAVCNTMAFAHSRGIIHRDLKPANIMLGKYGETLVVDWGLARTMIQTPEGKGIQPEFQGLGSNADDAATALGRAVGTPAYMSPEQAAGQWDVVGPASDIYALGATLYSILTGKVPHGSRREHLGQTQFGDLPRPRSMQPGIPRSLEAIYLKAMSLRPADRYSSPRDLADDLEHWLADEPVSAWTEPCTVKTRRWVSRHRTVVAGAAAAILVASITLGTATFLLARANHQLDDANQKERLARDNEESHKRRAEESYRIARKGLEKALAIRDDERLQSGKLEGIRKLLAKAGADFYQEFATLRGDEPSFQFERAMAYGQLAAVTAYMGDQAGALSDHERAVHLLESLSNDDPGNLEYLEALEKHYNDWGVSFLNLKQLAKAEELFHKSERIINQLIALQPEERRHRLSLAATTRNLGDIYRETHRLPEAEAAFKDSLSWLKELTANSSRTGKELRDWRTYADLHAELGYLYELTGQSKEVEQYRQEGIEILQQLVQANPREVEPKLHLAMSQKFLGYWYRIRNQYALAEPQYQAALTAVQELFAEHPTLAAVKAELADVMYGLAWVYQTSDRFAKAAQLYVRVQPLLEELVAEYPSNPWYMSKLAWTYNDMGILAKKQKRSKDELDISAKALNMRRNLVKQFPSIAEYKKGLADTLHNLGTAASDHDHLDEAIPYYQEAVKLEQELHDEDPDFVDYEWGLADGCFNLAFVFRNRGQLKEAKDLYLKAIPHFQHLLAKDGRNFKYQNRLAFTQTSLGVTCEGLNQEEEAQAAFKEAIIIRENIHKYSPFPAESALYLLGNYLMLANNFTRVGNAAQAMSWFDKAVNLVNPFVEKQKLTDDLRRSSVEVYAHRGRAMSKLLDKHDEALKSYDRALELNKVPDKDWILLGRATVLARKGMHIEAANVARPIVEKKDASNGNRQAAAGLFSIAATTVNNDPQMTESEKKQFSDQYAKAALSLLEKLVESGFFKSSVRRHYLAVDRDFGPIRERKEFQDILKKLEADK